MSYDNPVHAKTYAALGTRDNAAVRAKVSQAMKTYLTTNAKMPNAQAQRFVNAINFKTAADFKRAVDRATDWMKKEVHGRKYVLVVEGQTTWGANGTKSSAWLAHKVIEKLGKPYDVLTTRIDSWRGYGVISDTTRLKKAYENGVTAIVHLDDAWYSGTQKSEIVDWLLSESEHILNHPLGPQGLHVDILFAAAFGPRKLPELLQKHHKQHNISKYNNNKPSVFDVKFFVGGEIPEPPANLQKQVLFRARKYTVMPYKLPNHVSFGFNRVFSNGKAIGAEAMHHKLERYGGNVKPVYKKGINYSPSVSAVSDRSMRSARSTRSTRSVRTTRSVRSITSTLQPSKAFAKGKAPGVKAPIAKKKKGGAAKGFLSKLSWLFQ